MISYKDFVKKALNYSNVSVYLELNDCIFNEQDIDTLNDDLLFKCFIETCWIDGGVSGNDCWEYLNKYIDAEGELDIVQEIIEFFTSLNINLIESDLKDLIKFISFNGDEDYYGNYYQYSKSYVFLNQLYNLYVLKYI